MVDGSGSDRRASGYGWYVLILLTAVHVLGYIDRWILSLLIEPIKADLGLNDFQIGLLLGPAFALLFITFGVPFGWLADRVERRRLLAAGIALWCLFTAGSCLAKDFPTLFLMRMGVGIGEAVLAPCAFSLIADFFPAMQRPRAVSIFMTGTFIGAGTAFLIGGPIITYLE
uniref:MFS transporter n=1 Tax=Phenylobacterium sp. TaxID=1871053 RepID=UPI0039835DD4